MEEEKKNMIPLKPCKNAGCANLVRGGGYCDKHKKRASKTGAEEKQRKTSEAWHYLYNTKRWKEMRTQKLLLSPFCEECAREGRRKRGEEVDHIKPHRGNVNLFYDFENLQTLCKPCHSRKTMQERNHSPLSKR